MFYFLWNWSRGYAMRIWTIEDSEYFVNFHHCADSDLQWAGTKEEHRNSRDIQDEQWHVCYRGTSLTVQYFTDRTTSFAFGCSRVFILQKNCTGDLYKKSTGHDSLECPETACDNLWTILFKRLLRILQECARPSIAKGKISIVRKVDFNGKIEIDGVPYFIRRKLEGQYVVAIILTRQKKMVLKHEDEIIKSLSVWELRDEPKNIEYKTKSSKDYRPCMRN